MFAIETEIGRFEAETEREAKRLLRKAQRDHKKQQEIDKRDSDIARLKARSEAYRWIKSLYTGEIATACPWILERGEDYFPAEKIGLNQWQVYVDNDRQCPMELNGYEPIAVLCGLGGDAHLIWTESAWDNSRSVTCFAVGCEGRQYHTVIMPDELTVEYARKGGGEK